MSVVLKAFPQERSCAMRRPDFQGFRQLQHLFPPASVHHPRHLFRSVSDAAGKIGPAYVAMKRCPRVKAIRGSGCPTFLQPIVISPACGRASQESGANVGPSLSHRHHARDVVELGSALSPDVDCGAVRRASSTCPETKSVEMGLYYVLISARRPSRRRCTLQRRRADR